ncbi:hypothetical protein EVG20_g10294 [Dentipellis fragilis]|uniref:Uncharacterized protein n=1 Tax=Dentipellis fragilis TaxID=205917 RepID=A0A4Y9XRV4_9AGAM|nr:hypothetical protein EVG20_g10294 [Dentipellis fragilis]
MGAECSHLAFTRKDGRETGRDAAGRPGRLDSRSAYKLSLGYKVDGVCICASSFACSFGTGRRSSDLARRVQLAISSSRAAGVRYKSA